ncbi:CHAP domain-containing protein [Patescibacteria group bacterium]|nr:MAG: CHAP domain-containing protein [Patescibacteria group bacterium]
MKGAYGKLSKKSRKRFVRYGLVAANVAVLIAVTGFLVYSNRTSSSASQPAVFSIGQEDSVNPLDQLSSADIAVQIAQVTRVEQRTAVANKADTVKAQLSVSANDAKVVAKPQIVTEGLKSKYDITYYATVSGDTVGKVAKKFGITSDSVRWSNGIDGDALAAGKSLVIPPINGIVVRVTASDTPASLALKYNANKDKIIAFNDAEINGLRPGELIVIPGGSPESATPTVASYAPVVSSGSSFAWGGQSPVYGGNGYDYGYCTWWAAVRRAQIGRPIPSNLGNASTWKALAAASGLGVGGAPRTGAVIWTPPRDYYGHVGFVEEVYSDGRVKISEMNTVGWGVTSYKVLTPAQAAAYSYIY